MSLHCGYRRQAPDMEESCKYTVKAAAESRQRNVLHLGGWARG